MNTKTIISDLALKAKDSVVSYSELVPIVADLDLETLKEVEVGLNNRGLTFGIPTNTTPNDVVDVEELRKQLELPEFDQMTNKQRAFLNTTRMNRYNRVFIAAYQLAKTKEEKIEIQNILVANNDGLVLSAAKAYMQRSDYQDIKQCGNIGLIKAVRSYKFDESKIFGAYALDWVHKEINIWLKTNTSSYTIQSGQLDINPVLTKIVAEIYQEDPTAEITYEEVKRRFENRNKDNKTKRTLTPEAFKVFMSMRSNQIVSLDDTIGNVDSGDKNLTIAEVTGSGEDLEALEEAVFERNEQTKKLRLAMNAIEDDGAFVPTDGSAVAATWLKYNWIAQNPRYVKALGLKTAEEVGALIILKLGKLSSIQDVQNLKASDAYKEAKTFTSQELVNIHYMIAGCHGETRTRFDSKGNPVRKVTEEIHGNINAFKELVQSLPTEEKIKLVQGLTDSYPADILVIAEYFGVGVSGYVAAAPKSAMGENRQVSDEDIGASLGDMSRAAVGNKVKKATQQIQNAIKTLPEFE